MKSGEGLRHGPVVRAASRRAAPCRAARQGVSEADESRGARCQLLALIFWEDNLNPHQLNHSNLNLQLFPLPPLSAAPILLRFNRSYRRGLVSTLLFWGVFFYCSLTTLAAAKPSGRSQGLLPGMPALPALHKG